MIYAIKHNKVNSAIFKANEDALTSSFFERLMYLPQGLFHDIFAAALFNITENLEIHLTESKTFRPNGN